MKILLIRNDNLFYSPCLEKPQEGYIDANTKNKSK